MLQTNSTSLLGLHIKRAATVLYVVLERMPRRYLFIRCFQWWTVHQCASSTLQCNQDIRISLERNQERQVAPLLRKSAEYRYRKWVYRKSDIPMKKEDQDIPYSHVRILCKECGQTYFVKQKVLKRKTDEHNGWFPCEKCGSHNTTWVFRQ